MKLHVACAFKIYFHSLRCKNEFTKFRDVLAENLIIYLTYSIDLRAAMTCTYYMYNVLCIYHTDALISIRLAVPASWCFSAKVIYYF